MILRAYCRYYFLLIILISSFRPASSMQLMKVDTATENIVLQFSDGEISLEKRFAKVSRTLGNLLERVVIGTDTIALKDISLETWHFLAPFITKIGEMQLEGESDADITIKLIDPVFRFCEKRNPSEMVNLFNAINYLDMPLLASVMFRNYDLLKLPIANFRLLAPDLQRALLENYCVQHIGPLPARELIIPECKSGSFASSCIGNGWLAAASNDNRLEIWSLDNVQRTAECVGHAGEITCVSIAGEQVVTSSMDCTVRLWDRFSGQLIRTYEGHAAPIQRVCVEDACIISGSPADGAVRIWDLHSAQQRGACRAEENSYFYSFWKRGNRLIAKTGCLRAGPEEDEEVTIVYVWDWATGQEILKVSDEEHLDITEVCCNDNTLIIGFSDGRISLWDLSEHYPQAVTYRAHTSGIYSLFVAHQRLMSCTQDGEILVQDIVDGNEIVRYPAVEGFSKLLVCDQKMYIVTTQFEELCSSDESSSDEVHNVTASDNGITIRVRDLVTGAETAIYEHTCMEDRDVLIEDDRVIFCSNYPNYPRNISSIHTGNLVLGTELDIDSGKAIDLAFYRIDLTTITHGKLFAAASNGILRFWNIGIFNFLSCVNREQAQAVYALLETIVTRKAQGEQLSPAVCWQMIAALMNAPINPQ